MRVLACQVDVPPTPDLSARRAHVARLAAEIDRRLEGRSADLVALPELTTLDYSRDAFSNLAELAEDLEGETVNAFAELAARRNTAVCFGMARKAGAGDFRISQVAVGPTGVLGRYDKLHIAQLGESMEKEYFTPGQSLFLFRAGGLTVAPVICYDMRFPELFRRLRMEGAEVFLHAVAFVRDRTFASWPAFATTRAMENGCWLLSLNRAGERSGCSMLCPPAFEDGAPVVTFGTGEEFRFLDLDPAAVQAARAAYPFAGDDVGEYSRLSLDGSA